MVTKKDLGKLIKGILAISEVGVAEEKALHKFFIAFEPVLKSILQDKCFLKISCEGFEWVQIFDNQNELGDYLVRINNGKNSDFEYGVESTLEQIPFKQFVKLTDGHFMDFTQYLSVDDDLSFDLGDDNGRKDN